MIAARETFLQDGFAGASMDAIAKSAGVSVKTIYGHFANKNELFTRVMIGTCNDNLFAGEIPSATALSHRFAWFSTASRQGLFEAGREYLCHLLSVEEVALYRAVTRDAIHFPELGRQYQQVIARNRTGILIAYLTRLYEKKKWIKRNVAEDAASYEGLLRAMIFEEALHGISPVTAERIEHRAFTASKMMWALLVPPSKDRGSRSYGKI